MESNLNLISPWPTYTQAQIAEACRTWGKSLWVPQDVDGVRLLWALSGCESSYGRNCEPRHEAIYCTGRYSASADVVRLTALYGHGAHCSYGPWQLLLVNCDQIASGLHNGTSPTDMLRLDRAAMETVGFINRRILQHEKAQTVDEIADAYNSGDWRDALRPATYIAECLHNYNNVPMPMPAQAQA